MDARNMSEFQTGSFDAVIDKGTLDSILCGNNSRQHATQMLKEVGRYNSTVKDIMTVFCFFFPFSFWFFLICSPYIEAVDNKL
uniref:Methyltransferase 13 isoform X2 n=1 Tax=Bixa orellana TaxID=66672 RepID=A0A9Y0ZFU4_BIXOR|nr:methyltransferase 13 isoform X2 [Bixa orellana]